MKILNLNGNFGDRRRGRYARALLRPGKAALQDRPRHALENSCLCGLSNEWLPNCRRQIIPSPKCVSAYFDVPVSQTRLYLSYVIVVFFSILDGNEPAMFLGSCVVFHPPSRFIGFFRGGGLFLPGLPIAAIPASHSHFKCRRDIKNDGNCRGDINPLPEMCLNGERMSDNTKLSGGEASAQWPLGSQASATGDAGVAATSDRARHRALRYDSIPCLHPIQTAATHWPPPSPLCRQALRLLRLHVACGRGRPRSRFRARHAVECGDMSPLSCPNAAGAYTQETGRQVSQFLERQPPSCHSPSGIVKRPPKSIKVNQGHTFSSLPFGFRQVGFFNLRRATVGRSLQTSPLLHSAFLHQSPSKSE